MKTRIFLLLFFTTIFNVSASQIDTLFVKSKSMDKTISNIVITPNSYSSNSEKFPVLYLLHGAGGNHLSWIAGAPKIQEYANLYNIIIVCPDGDKTSWYFDSPIDKKMKYETYISKELVPTIDKLYNTLATKNGRAITGLSMGGHGALYLAFKHQNVWAAAGSMSGGLDLLPFPNNWKIADRLGNYNKHKKNWVENSVINMVYLLNEKGLKLIIDCGVSDFFYDVNLRFHKKLLKLNIPHDYTERPGKHDWNYWQNSIQYQLLYFYNFFNEN